LKATVVLACDDRFVPFVSVAARRIARLVGDEATIIVVSAGVSDENKALAIRFCPAISFVEASSLVQQMAPAGSILNGPHYLRLFLDELFPHVDRVVYLDGDVSLLADISPLLSLVPRASPIVAAHDPYTLLQADPRSRLSMSADAAYFNSGVMVLDLKVIRQEGIFAVARAFADRNPESCWMADQDALNAALDGRWQTLDWRWNSMSYLGDRVPRAPFIRHFAGNKPWGKSKTGVEARFVHEWQSDLEESPWKGCFHRQTRWQAASATLRPHVRRLETGVKRLLFGRASGKRGHEARLAIQFPHGLEAIERAAARGELACRSPETVLFGLPPQISG